MGKNVYSSEVKWAVIKDKMSGQLTNQEIMEKHGIKNKTQISTWMKWYKNNEIHRFDQPIGKQYTYGLGPDILSEEEKKEKKYAHLKQENEILKKVLGDGKGVEREVVLQLVEKLRKKYTVSAVLSVLNVPRANYYRWVKTLPLKSLSREETVIISLCKETKYRYGHRKIKALLWRQHQVKLNRNTVQRIMQKHHLQCRVKPKKRWKSQGETIVVAPNLLERNFRASAPNQKWVTDITYIQYGSSTLYLSTVIDLYNNQIVAYKLYTHQQTPLVMDTLKEALDHRGNPKGVILHSDQGSVYTSYAFQNFVKEEEVISSMSRRGNCWDNAVIESFHSNLKSEQFQYVKFNSLSLDKVREQIDHYINYYNEERIQEKLGYHSPMEFGRMAA
ncbi:IS3 family transposase [Fictibacillus enclensis]|uniref:IS3 family transposase n=1 Tax=Fictibacillus enclensis TaxID=1017270 RepID=UPI0024BF3700|nr:IS3 family transposase [Fictibacillus enclensis]WHY70217.1 IS3 family transposase [Fictibacillus enclensis]WHY72330.1 IS3 family transposase [Fictibacillus enclensis]WHY73490.1 IS3 family transposase [Fictibacillus enclensis]